MPFFALIQAVAARIILGFIALIAVLGIGSMAEPPIREIPGTVPSEITLPNPIQLIDSTDTQEPEDIPEIPPSQEDITPTPPIVKEVVPPPPPPVEVGIPPVDTSLPLSFSTINTETQKALVNILCSATTESPVSSITGSGVIISPNGIVITNAHIAQFFLLKDYPSPGSIECVLRTGSPARTTYQAELLYIAPQWVQEHAEDILDEHPTGTGEHDYAFLHITGRTDPKANLPEPFPFVALDTSTEKVVIGNNVLAAAYPAGFLEGSSIQKNLYIVSSIATIGERFTFNGAGVDLFSIGGTVVSQGGSSGGAAVSDENKLVGIVVTSTQATTTAERDMRAITIAHINRSLLARLGSDIRALISGNTAATANSFNTTMAPSLTALFLTHIAK